MMSKFEEYLNSLDKRNLFMLYFSVIITASIFYYYVNYSIFSNKVEENQNRISSMMFKLKDTKSLEFKIKKIKKEYKSFEQKILNMKEDLKYLELLIATSDVMNLNDEKFVGILNSILDSAIVNGINPSYLISKTDKNFTIYSLNLSGKFQPDQYKSFYRLIKSVEKIKAIKDFDYVKIDFDKSNVKYEMKINFWGVK